jgi:hypothetical protein
MSLIDDWTYEIIRACGLSTSNSDVNIIGLHRCIKEIMSIKNLTDEEINKLWAESHEDGIAMQQGFTTQQHYFAHLILQRASEK